MLSAPNARLVQEMRSLRNVNIGEPGPWSYLLRYAASKEEWEGVGGNRYAFALTVPVIRISRTTIILLLDLFTLTPYHSKSRKNIILNTVLDPTV